MCAALIMDWIVLSACGSALGWASGIWCRGGSSSSNSMSGCGRVVDGVVFDGELDLGGDGVVFDGEPLSPWL